MKKVETAVWSASIYCDCPYCGKQQDLVEMDHNAAEWRLPEDLRLVERDRGKYGISESYDLNFSFKYLFKKYVLEDILERIEAYAEYLDAH